MCCFGRVIDVRVRAYMTAKQAHCTPIWRIPSNPDVHSNPLRERQQLSACRLAGIVNTFANAHVPDVVPKRIKYGLMPSEERRATSRMCCGR